MKVIQKIIAITVLIVFFALFFSVASNIGAPPILSLFAAIVLILGIISILSNKGRR